MKIGFIVNPIAGVGAALAWKGTDNLQQAWEAVENGAKQPVFANATRALRSVRDTTHHKWYLNFEPTVDFGYTTLDYNQTQTTSADTHRVVTELINLDVELIVFVGGDGTAADVASCAKNVPIIGIPSGVKIFSACFLHKPEDFGELIAQWSGEISEVEIVDLDEDAYRQGKIIPRVINSTNIPVFSKIQAGKISYSERVEETAKLIADRIEEENLLQNKTILVGPGKTMQNIFSNLGCDVALLGINIVINSNVEVYDATYKDLVDVNADEIWLSPIGNQGHIFGRGNRQLPVEIIERVGKEGLKIFSTLQKIQNTPYLFVDTGSNKLDKMLEGFYPVIVGYYEEILRKVMA